MRRTHGDTGTRLYRIWKSMKCRCLCPSYPPYKRYGARGINVCEDWAKSYEAFRTWAYSHGYADDLELERIDVNGNYDPKNCSWITHHEQTLNRRDTLYIQIHGVRERLRDFCNDHNISMNTVNNWRHLGVLEQKLSELYETEVEIIGGKKNSA